MNSYKSIHEANYDIEHMKVGTKVKVLGSIMEVVTAHGQKVLRRANPTVIHLPKLQDGRRNRREWSK